MLHFLSIYFWLNTTRIAPIVPYYILLICLEIVHSNQFIIKLNFIAKMADSLRLAVNERCKYKHIMIEHSIKKKIKLDTAYFAIDSFVVILCTLSCIFAPKTLVSLNNDNFIRQTPFKIIIIIFRRETILMFSNIVVGICSKQVSNEQ